MCWRATRKELNNISLNERLLKAELPVLICFFQTPAKTKTLKRFEPRKQNNSHIQGFSKMTQTYD